MWRMKYTRQQNNTAHCRVIGQRVLKDAGINPVFPDCSQFRGTRVTAVVEWGGVCYGTLVVTEARVCGWVGRVLSMLIRMRRGHEDKKRLT